MLKKTHIKHLAMCYDPPLVRDKPIGVPAFVKHIQAETT